MDGPQRNGWMDGWMPGGSGRKEEGRFAARQRARECCLVEKRNAACLLAIPPPAVEGPASDIGE